MDGKLRIHPSLSMHASIFIPLLQSTPVGTLLRHLGGESQRWIFHTYIHPHPSPPEVTISLVNLELAIKFATPLPLLWNGGMIWLNIDIVIFSIY
jgi:hypothetical protein